MREKKKLSPCARSVFTSLPDEVSSWEIARALFVMHPEYAKGKMERELRTIDKNFEGKKKTHSLWIDRIGDRYSDERILHGRVVILGLYYGDADLRNVFPVEVIRMIETDVEQYNKK